MSENKYQESIFLRCTLHLFAQLLLTIIFQLIFLEKSVSEIKLLLSLNLLMICLHLKYSNLTVCVCVCGIKEAQNEKTFFSFFLSFFSSSFFFSLSSSTPHDFKITSHSEMTAGTALLQNSPTDLSELMADSPLSSPPSFPHSSVSSPRFYSPPQNSSNLCFYLSLLIWTSSTPTYPSGGRTLAE